MAKKSRASRRPMPAKKITPPPRRSKTTWWLIVILLLITVSAYEPLRHNDFIQYDTDVYVTNNPAVQQGLTIASVKWALTQSHAANWHPLTWMSHMLDCQVFGLNKPWGHHFTNLFFHLLNTLLLFWVLQKMTGSIGCGFFVAALFALHPLHVESVAWIAERKDVLSTMFWILTMAAYTFYVQHPNVIRYLLVFFSMALGLMAKPMLVTLPLVLLLLDYWPLNRFSLPISRGPQKQTATKPSSAKSMPLHFLLLEKVPLLTLAITSCVITYLVQQSGGAVKNILNYPWNIRIENALISYVNYILKMFYPLDLAVLYPHPGDNIPAWQWVASLPALIAVTVLIIYFLRRYRYLTVGWLWYLGTLVPVIGLIQVGVQARADRYTYIPLIGLFIMIAWGVAELSQKWRRRQIILTLLMCLVLLPLLILTRRQLRHWRTSTILFEHTLALTENNDIMHHNFGRMLADQGNITAAQKHFARAIDINPNYARAHNNLGVMLVHQGLYQDAIKSFTQALKIRGPDNPDNYNTYHNMAKSLAFLKDNAGAIVHYRLALKFKPDSFETLNDLSWLLATSSDPALRNGPDAVAGARRACELTNYQRPETLSTLAAAYAETGQFAEAVNMIQKAISLYRSLNLQSHADRAVRHLKLYQAGQPFRDKI